MILEYLDIKKLYTQWFAEIPRILACSDSIIKPDIRLAVGRSPPPRFIFRLKCPLFIVIGIKLSIGAPTLEILESRELKSKFPTPHLFISIPKIDSRGVVSAPQAYWSINIDGLIPMSQNDMICYGLNQPELFLHPQLAYLDSAYVQTLVELHSRCGFTQDSLQASKLLRTPLHLTIPGEFFVIYLLNPLAGISDQLIVH
ncbi:hypothetical protein BDQ12DRAFT_124797 [Crucibulum laeve]|uniref:Uncharacterized protein n=1 Tax=Crucibulum laeve TaxID=68775 RepID=A0A5C3LY73_9AGAR|nr:hypothetical protein BDQ12DRAFT_124797 [Crucibulum laeve]